MYGTVHCVLNGVTGRIYYTHANKKKATQFTGFVENKYRHEHVKIINSYSVLLCMLKRSLGLYPHLVDHITIV